MDYTDQEDLDRVVLDTERQMRDLLDAMKGLSEITGVGESRSGLVTARVDSEGRISDVTLSGRAMRLEGQELSQEVVEAVRAAQEDHERRARASLAGPLADETSPEAIRRGFEELQDSYARESADRIDRIRRVAWDPSA
ncbi:YbaB/EbfC family nucleoid-associated protein [Nonomuraea dietziae]|uniref:YbaB/EbfC family nucleoid-associated protein n=1 Tax=Nonomuraea dietziae TaxID=65515 RepID=UPI00342C5DCA